MLQEAGSWQHREHNDPGRSREGSQGWAELCVYGQGVPRGALRLHIRANMGVNQHSGIDFS